MADPAALRRPGKPAAPTLDAVLEFRTMVSGRMSTADLSARYDALRRSRGHWPALSDKALVQALKVTGATPWRSSTARGLHV